MVGSTWDCGRLHAGNWAALAFLPLALAACSASSSAGDSGVGGFGPDSSVADGFGGGAPSPGPPGAAGFGSVTGPGAPGNGECIQLQTRSPVFAPQVFSDLLPARAELYSWATDEDAAEMRRNHALLPSLMPGDAIGTALLGLSGNGSAAAQVATILNATLATARSAWPEPWAVRVGPHGEDLGRNLLRIVLKPEAWVAVIEHGTVEVLNMQNERLSLSDTAAAPERFGAIFHAQDGDESGQGCGASPLAGNAFFREVLVGNLGMVQEWSLGTQQIHDHLLANVAQLSEFLARTRPCPDQTQPLAWGQQVVCNWQDGIPDITTEQAAYQQAVAIATPDYFDAPAALGAMVDRLQGARLDLDPLLVTPGSP